MAKPSLQRLMIALFIFAIAANLLPAPSAAKGPEFPGETEQRPAANRGDCSFLNNAKIMGDARSRMRELSRFTEEFAAQRVVASATSAKITEKNFIDTEIFAKMAANKIEPAPLSTDEEFLRRAMLDLTGRIPTPEQARAFLADTASDKRDRLITSLIGSPEFVDRWTMYFGDLVQNSAFSPNIQRYPQGRNAFHKVIREAVEKNTPYNQFVTTLITGDGNTFESGAANHIIGAITQMGPAQDTLDTAVVQTTTRFLGMNVFDCLLCHDGQGHLNALNLWGTNAKRSEAWGMSAYFARTGIRLNRVSQQPLVFNFEVFDTNFGNYMLNTTAGNRTPRQPIDGQNFVSPRYIFSGETPVVGENYRQAYARIMTRDRQFARATVNYMWAEFFGLGIVDPPTNFDLARLDAKNPPPEPWTLQPSHPELLEKLTDEFISSGYNLQHVMRLITQSSAYQLSSRYPGEWKEEYTTFFARKLVRRLDSEEVHDAVARATNILGNYYSFGFTQPFQYAMQLPDTLEPFPYRGANGQTNPFDQQSLIARNFLNTFQRGDRGDVPRSSDPSILQGLTMMNNPFVTARVRATNNGGTVARLLATASSDKALVEEMFLATLSRLPNSTELERGMNMLKANRTQGAEDLMWVLLNKIDFLYNY